MPGLEFNFHESRSAARSFGIALLLVGLTATAWSWMSLQAAQASQAGLALQLAELKRVQSRSAILPPAPTNDAAAAAQSRMTAQLTYAWQPAFEALAAASNPRVALVSFEAHQAKSQIRLVAEARQLADAIDYIDVLQQQNGVKRATLTQHERQDKSVEHPVRFTVLLELSS